MAKLLNSGESKEISEAEDHENIPYHAREYAQPFTYGNLPKGFKRSDLNHVQFDDDDDTKPNRSYTIIPASPSSIRKTARPTIRLSPPILRKAPSREEFEEMLKERQEQALKEKNNISIKNIQNSAIQKELDLLQESLNQKIITEEKALEVNRTNKAESPENFSSSSNEIIEPNRYQPLLAITDSERPETPDFPLAIRPITDGRCTSPYTMDQRSPTPIQQRTSPSIDFKDGGKKIEWVEQQYNDTAPVVGELHEVESHLVNFVKDFSEYWYKPYITREEAVELLRNASPGTFIVRNSTTYKNAYGLVIRVAKPPSGVSMSEDSRGDELVRHFLVEPTSRGVRLKSCANEPIFTSLSALVYEHSINKLALPCKLIIPEKDLFHSPNDAELLAKQKLLLQQGAACNVLYLFTCGTESLTGDEAIRKAIYELYAQSKLPTPVEVHFKVSQCGITLTDNKRRFFFRRHFMAQNISHFGMDPDNRFWSVLANDEGLERAVNKSIFGFVARPLTGGKDNQCHLFCDLAASQPASAIISFAQKVILFNQHNEML